MISVKWDKNRCQDRIELPSGWVFYSFLKGEQALFCGYTPNLGQRLGIIKSKVESDTQYAELSAAADTLRFESHPTAMEALIRHKVYVQQQYPQYQNSLRPSADYVYLALDAWHFPFASLQSHTNDDWLYIGPWRSRFFLLDIMDSLARILRIPFCETGSFPCEKLDDGRCRGYCLALEKDGEESPEAGLDKLESLLREAYVHPNNGILEMVTQERDNYFNDLEFIKADLLDDEIEILSQYRDWLNFLYVTKSLAFSETDFGVEKGLLSWCRYEGREYNFTIPEVQYRENERLALNLQDVDEARLIYEYHAKHHKG